MIVAIQSILGGENMNWFVVATHVNINIHNKRHALESMVFKIYLAISCHCATMSQNSNFEVKLKIAPCKRITP